MNSLFKNSSFHHLEVPCEDLELAERFYVAVFGASVYMRRDVSRRNDAPAVGTIAEAEEKGFQIDGTYMKIGEVFRIGFLKRQHEHAQREIDHLAFVIDDEDLAALSRRLTEYKIEVIDRDSNRMLIRDPFGLMLELWPKSVLNRMGLL
jgi:catechol 2,3-dioxygenase-like lactoylglutathione lyase family enzyme